MKEFFLRQLVKVLDRLFRNRSERWWLRRALARRCIRCGINLKGPTVRCDHCNWHYMP